MQRRITNRITNSITDLYTWYYTKPSTKQPLHEIKKVERKNNLSREIEAELLSEWQAYDSGSHNISTGEDLTNSIALLEKINQHKHLNEYHEYSLKLQKSIIDAIDDYKGRTILLRYETIIFSLEKDNISDAELEKLENFYQKGLEYCNRFNQFNKIILNKLNAFTEKNQKDLKFIFELTKPFSDKGRPDNPPKEGFYFCKNAIDAKRIENENKNKKAIEAEKAEKEIKKICDDVTIICKHVEYYELDKDTNNYQSLKSLRDLINKEVEKLKKLTAILPSKTAEIDHFIEDIDKTTHHLENKMTEAQLFSIKDLHLIKDPMILTTIKELLKKEPSYLALMDYYGAHDAFSEKKQSCLPVPEFIDKLNHASPEKKENVFPQFIDKINNAHNLDELYALLVEGHRSKVRDLEDTIENRERRKNIAENTKLNSDMIRNTKCGIYGLFGLFDRSTSHRFLKQVATDFQRIVDEYFENQELRKTFRLKN